MRHLLRGTATILVLLTGAAGVLGQGATKPAPKEPRDALGRKLPWGPATGGFRASLHMLRTRLLYGQPLECRFQMVGVARKETCYWPGPGNSMTFKLFDETGRPVPVAKLEEVSPGQGHRVQLGNVHGSGKFLLARLTPTGPHAIGRYLRPGKYRLTARADSNYPWYGRKIENVRANTVRFEVLAAKVGLARVPAAPGIRKKAEAMARQLAAGDLGKREAAAKALVAMGFDALPWIEAAAGSADPKVAARAEAILWQLAQPAATVAIAVSSGRLAEYGPLLAEFGEPTWRVVAGKVKKNSYTALRVRAACYASIGPPRDLRKPSEAEVKRILARLKDKDPAVRMLAIRRISATPNAAILAALLERLDDPFRVWLQPFFCCPHPLQILQKEAIHALTWQGPMGIDALGAAVDDKARAALHPVILRYLPEFQFAPVADRKRLAPLIRFVRQHLRRWHQSRSQSASKAAAGPLRLRELLPDLIQLCRNRWRPHLTRDSALAAIYKMAERSELKGVLLDLLDEKEHVSLRSSAANLLGMRGYREAVPQLLDALEQDNSRVRGAANDALRLLADKPKGVGFVHLTKTPEARKQEADKWRRWFKEHPTTVRQGSPRTQPARQP